VRTTGNALVLAGLLVAVTASASGACGPESDCMLRDRSYRIVLPPGHDGAAPIGAIIFAHGYRGTADGVMRNQSLTALAGELGVAFVAAQAAGSDWNLPGSPGGSGGQDEDELAYFDALSADLAGRFGVERARTLMTGFSAGGMMVWHLACQRGDAYAGFAPMSGTFWEPLPEDCPAGPVNLIHYHGDSDPTVPLHGRAINEAHQGDVYKAVTLMARAGGYRPAESVPEAGLDCERQESGSGHRLELCLFAGRHQIKVGHILRTWRLFGL
jgi:polyhydroxybutyrate depolymerase